MAVSKIPCTAWRKIDEVVGTANSITLAGISFSELLVIVDINQGGNKVTFYLIKDALPTSSTNWYRAGGNDNSVSTGALVTIWSNGNYMGLTAAVQGTNNYSSNTKTIVYYR